MKKSNLSDDVPSQAITTNELLTCFDYNKREILNVFDDIVLSWVGEFYEFGFTQEIFMRYMHLFRYIGQMLRNIEWEPTNDVEILPENSN